MLLEASDLMRPLGKLARATHRALVGYPVGLWVLYRPRGSPPHDPPSLWSLARAEALPSPHVDDAVLFTVMTAVTIPAVSIGGWGLREVAVVARARISGGAGFLLLSLWLGPSCPVPRLGPLYSPACVIQPRDAAHATITDDQPSPDAKEDRVVAAPINFVAGR